MPAPTGTLVQEQRNERRRRERALLTEDGLRRCSRCDEVKVLGDFHRKPSRADGLASECAECNRAARRARYAADPVAYREGSARWQRENPDAVRRRDARRRARLHEAFVEDVDPKIVWERDEGVCGICDHAVEGAFDVDHIVPLSQGGEHSYANAQVSHPSCNRSKGGSIVAPEKED